MARAKQFIDAPRLQVVLVPDSESENVNVATALFDIWLLLHVPDGKSPTTVRVDGGPFDRDDAVRKLSEIWNYLGQKYAEPRAKRI
jgi:hypothetical protein